MKFVQIVSVRVKPERIDQVAEVYRTDVLPASKGLPGLQAAYLLLDRSSLIARFLSFWDSVEAIEAVQREGHFARQVSKFDGLVAAPPERVVSEILVSLSD